MYIKYITHITFLEKLKRIHTCFLIIIIIIIKLSNGNMIKQLFTYKMHDFLKSLTRNIDYIK